MSTVKTSSTTTTALAGAPYPLIPTPAFTGDRSDPFIIAATEMALVHNTIIRGLNSIYLQARTVAPTPTPSSPADTQLRDDFVAYAKLWSAFLHAHHEGEEEKYFPTIESCAGVKGLMDVNVGQHEAFSAGLKTFDEYLASVSPSPTRTKHLHGDELCQIIDAFGGVLTTHLTEEIATIIGLNVYGDRVPIVKISADEGEHVMKTVPMATVMMFFLVNLDLGYEGGIHAHFPPAPGIVKFVLKWVLFWQNRRLWRFASCDRFGKLRQLPFAAAMASEK